MNKQNLGLKIGIVFSVISFLMTFTFLVPIFSVIPGSFLIELITSVFINENVDNNIGKIVLIILSTIMIIFLLLVLKGIKKIASKQLLLNKTEIILIMIFFYFIIHPLGFYIYWALFLNFVGDGQIIFEAATSFPYSSISFILLGILIDLVWKKEYIKHK